MKNVIRNTLVICLGVGLMGCEWQGGGEGNSWNDRYNFVNFSGSYRGAGGGGLLVSQYTGTVVTDTGDGGGGTSGSYVTVNGESDGSRTVPANGVQRLFTGSTNGKPVKPGSLTIAFGGDGNGFFSDDGSGHLEGSILLEGVAQVAAVEGTIEYDTGVWSILLVPPGIPSSGSTLTVSVTLSYLYESTGTSSGSSGSGSSGPASGATKVTIYVFNVAQEGNKLQIVDNNGSTYQGSFGSIRSTGGSDQDSTYATYSNGDQIMGQFEAKGRSAANIDVKMVGTFQATIAGAVTADDGTTTSMQLSDRRIMGTWIESNGKTGDINGQAAPVSVSTTTTTPTTP